MTASLIMHRTRIAHSRAALGRHEKARTVEKKDMKERVVQLDCF
jgi:hypothetical protein